MVFLTDPNRKGILVILGFLAALVVVALFAKALAADEPAEVEGTFSQDVEDVNKMISHLVGDYPQHPMNKGDWSTKMSKQIVSNANEHGAPVDLVTAISFRESSLRWNLTGPGGELGIMQVHPFTIRKFKCDMDTVAGQIDCGCRVLAWHHDRCGSDWKSALAAYGSKTANCHPKLGSKLSAMVKDRFKLAAELRKVADR